MTKGPNPLIEVFVLCYNRKEFVAESIRSVLAQTYQPLRLIISDNSTTEAVSEFLKTEFSGAEIRRRQPSLSNYDHLNRVIDESIARYFMIFHDDDILEPNYVTDVISALEKNGASAGCANARLLIDGQKTERLFNPTLPRDLLLSSPKSLAKNYLDYSYGVNPLPGYIYRREAVKNLRFNLKEGGQYCDVAFLVKVAQTGPVFWGAKPAMYYRKHSGNVSGNISFIAVKRLIQFLIDTGLYSKSSSELLLFRYWNHLFLVKNRNLRGRRWKPKETMMTVKYFASHPAPLLRKLMQKFKF